MTARLAARLALGALLASAIVWVAFHRDRFDGAALDAWVASLGVWGPLAFAGLYAIGTVVFVPGVVFALVGGALFGPLWGAALNLVGATIGATAAFLLARLLAGDWVARKAGGFLGRLIAGVEAEGWRFVAFVRLVPLFPFNLSNYALGLTRIGFLAYVATSFVGMAPGALAYTWLGYAGRGAVSGDAQAIRYALLGLGALAAVAFLRPLVARMRSKPPELWIGTEELRRRLDSGAAVTVVDVRGAAEFDGPLDHIPGARNIPLADLPKRLDELRPRAADGIVLVCVTDRRSATAASDLSGQGFGRVAVLRGGMKEWNARGFPLSRGPSSGSA